MNALIHMQPLNARRQPVYQRKLVGTLPRDAQPHQISGEWELDRTKEMPYYVRVWADNGRGFDFEFDGTAPERFRKLASITVTQILTVQPRRQ